MIHIAKFLKSLCYESTTPKSRALETHHMPAIGRDGKLAMSAIGRDGKLGMSAIGRDGKHAMSAIGGDGLAEMAKL